MQCQELIIDQTTYWESIESLHKQLVSLLIVLIYTFCAEVKELGHLATLVVSTQHVYSRGKVEFERVKKKYDFTGERSSVDIVSQEQIFCLLRITSYIQHFHKIIILSMNVAYNSHRII